MTIKQCLEVGKYYALAGNTEKEGEETPLLVTLHHQSDSREVGGRSERLVVVVVVVSNYVVIKEYWSQHTDAIYRHRQLFIEYTQDLCNVQQQCCS